MFKMPNWNLKPDLCSRSQFVTLNVQARTTLFFLYQQNLISHIAISNHLKSQFATSRFIFFLSPFLNGCITNLRKWFLLFLAKLSQGFIYLNEFSLGFFHLFSCCRSRLFKSLYTLAQLLYILLGSGGRLRPFISALEVTICDFQKRNSSFDN